MTKKDYELFANEIYSLKGKIPSQTLGAIIDLTTLCFQKDNSNFNPIKYATACYEGKHIRKSIAEAV